MKWWTGAGLMMVAAIVLWSCAPERKPQEWKVVDLRVPCPSLPYRPPPGLPVREEDFRRFPRDGFAFVLEDPSGFKVNSAAGLVTMAKPGELDTTIAASLDETQLDAIYQKAIAIRVFGYPEPSPVLYSPGYLSIPGGIARLSVRVDGTTKSFAWDSRKIPGGPNEDEWKRLFELVLLIWDTVEEHPSVKAVRAKWLANE